MRLIVLGSTGYLGRHVIKHAAASHMQVVGTRFAASQADARRVDVTDLDAVRRLIDEAGPDAIVNAVGSASGLTSTSTVNWAVNAQGATNVAAAAHERGVRLVHISSDAIFAGRTDPYAEADPPTPVYPYGAAKAAAELAVAAVCPSAAMARPSVIVADGDEMSRRESHILDLAAGRIDGAYFVDEVRCPVGVNDLAKACLELATGDFAGVLNMTGPEAVTLHDFARAVAERHGLDPGHIPSSDHASAGLTRPGRVVLDTAKAQTILETRLRGISEIVARP